MISLVLILLLLPLLGGLLGFIIPIQSAVLSSASTLFSFVISIIFLATDKYLAFSWVWIQDIELSIYLDSTSLLLVSLVTFVSFLVQVFSSAYMKKDAGINRYYAKLGFFVFSMIGLLLADSLLLLFVFWELVGLASYLLIGFWYQKEGIPKSARTAFMVNRVADTSLLAGIILTFQEIGSLSITSLGDLSTTASFFFVVGAFGKSAQFPFSGWLTKAMVGPTPISALIHAATMVAAGVYLLFRVAPFLDSNVLLLVAVVGTFTAFYAALCAIVQFDIKRVLAYSTISQLGYMILGIGVGARDASLFHLFTHAFFKAGLFLGAASIIHYLHQTSKLDSQDMRFMGGLKKRLPWTYRSFLVCGLALAGLPFFSGFMSKDGILIGAWQFAENYGAWAYLIPDVALITALMTAFYAIRMILLVFWGQERSTLSEAMTEVKVIIYPLVILGLFSFWIVHNWNPLAHNSFVFSLVNMSPSQSGGGELIPFLSVVLSGAGLVLAYSFFKPGTVYNSNFMILPKPTSRMSALVFNGLWLTRIYAKIGEFTYQLSQSIYWIDRRLFDATIEFVAVFGVILSKIIALIDRFAVDGPVNWIAGLSAFVGKNLAKLSSRDGQTQLAWMLTIVILILLLIIVF